MSLNRPPQHPHTFDTLIDTDAYLLTIRQQITSGTWLSPNEQLRAERVAAISGTNANKLFEKYLDEGDLKQERSTSTATNGTASSNPTSVPRPLPT